MQALDLRAGVGPEVLGEAAAQQVVVFQRLGGAAAAVQRQHQLPGQALVQRVLRRGGTQLDDHFSVPAEGEIRVDPAGQHVQPQLLKRRQLDTAQRVRGHVGQRRPAPQRPGLVHIAFGQQFAHVEQVELARLDMDHVAGGRGADRVASEQVAQPHDVGADGVPGAGWRIVFPQPFDQLVVADHGVGPQQQRRQQDALLGGGHHDLAAVHQHAQRAQHPVLGASGQHAGSLTASREELRRGGDSDT